MFNRKGYHKAPGRARPNRPHGPRPAIRRCADGDAELDLLVATIRRLTGDGLPAAEIAVLVRMNAQVPPLEAALTWLPLGAQYFVRGRKPAA